MREDEEDDDEPSAAEREEAERWMELGFEHAWAGRWDDALAAAARLRELRHSSSFEIAALAYAGRGQRERAVEELEEGVALAEEVWRLWQLLANYRSDLGRFAEADAAYDRALACPRVDADSVRLNRCVIAMRAGEPERALASLAQPVAAEHALLASALRVEALTKLGQLALAERVATEALAVHEIPDDHDQQNALDRIAGDLLTVRKTQGDTPEALRALASELAGRLGNRKPCVLWWLRELRGTCSPEARTRRILVHGSFGAGSPGREWGQGWFGTFVVVSDTLEQALEYVREVHDYARDAELSIEEHEDLGPRPELPHGVYDTNGATFYAEHDPSEDEASDETGADDDGSRPS